MKWMILISSVLLIGLIGGILANDDFSSDEIPDDILEMEDDVEDEEILREIERKANDEDTKREEWHARDVASRYNERNEEGSPRFGLYLNF
jgi:hypothetical protein